MGSDSVPDSAVNAGHRLKLSDFKEKCGPAGRAAIPLAHVWTFHPWVMDVYGGLHSGFLEDLRGIAAHIARGATGRVPGSSGDARVSSASTRDLLTLLSFELQRQLFRFFDDTLDLPSR